MGDLCRCGRQLVKVHGSGANTVVPVASTFIDDDGKVALGPFPRPELRHLDNTPACPPDRPLCPDCGDNGDCGETAVECGNEFHGDGRH